MVFEYLILALKARVPGGEKEKEKERREEEKKKKGRK